MLHLTEPLLDDHSSTFELGVRLLHIRPDGIQSTMAKILDGPVPEGARSVSWPWYHHTLTTELTVDARTLLEQYSKIPASEVEKHIYRIVSRQLTTNIASCIDRLRLTSI